MRVRYGTTSADVVVNQLGEPRRGVVLTVWDAEAGGTQFTQVYQGGTMTGGPVVSTDGGRFVFEVELPAARTVWVEPANATDRVELMPSGGMAGSASNLAIVDAGDSLTISDASGASFAASKSRHAATHRVGGSDPVGLDAGQITTGRFSTDRLGAGTATGSARLAGDGTWRANDVASVTGLSAALAAKADLVNGKVPASQLPASSGSGGSGVIITTAELAAALGVPESDLIGDMRLTTAKTAVFGSPDTFTANGLTSTYYDQRVTSPKGLVLYLHGDGTAGPPWEFLHQDDYSIWTANGVLAKASASGFCCLAPKAPDNAGDCTWWEAGASNADWIAALLSSYRQQHDLNGLPLIVMGYSGGSQQTTKHLVPLHPEIFTSGSATLVIGGGGKPSVNAAYNPNIKVMRWETGTGETAANTDGWDAIGEAQAAAAYYQSLGQNVLTQWQAGAQHDYWEGLFGTELERFIRDNRIGA